MSETKRTSIIDKDGNNTLANIVESNNNPGTYGLVALNADGTAIGSGPVPATVRGTIVGTLADQLDLQTALDAKANESDVVLLTTNQEISGVKDFVDFPTVPSLGPNNPLEVASKQYVDLFLQGLQVKAAVRLATTVADGNIALTGVISIDGSNSATGDRILVKQQTLPATNGIYIANDAGAWTRATDYDTSAEVEAGTFGNVLSGSTLINTQRVQVTENPTLGTDPLVFSQLSTIPAYTGSLGVQVVGQDIRANLKSSGGLNLDGNQIQIAPNGVVNSMFAPAFTTGYIPFSNGTNLTVDAAYFWDNSNKRLGVGTSTPVSSIEVQKNSLGVTPSLTDGLTLRNTTAAGAGAQQKSPSLWLQGQGWKTTATAASQSVTMGMEVLPVQGSSAPSGLLQFQTSINGAAPTIVGAFSSTGAFYTGSSTTNANIWATTGATAASTSSTRYTLLGAATALLRVGLGGATTYTVTSNLSYGNVIVGNSPVTEASSGTHPLIANLAVKSWTFNSGVGATTNAATVYIEGPFTGTATPVNSYALWSDAGVNRFDGLFNAGGTTLTANQIWGANAGGTAMEGKTLIAGANISISQAAGTITINGLPGVIFGAPASGFVNGEIQYIDQSGNQYGDTQFTRDSGDEKQTDMYANTKAMGADGISNDITTYQADEVGAAGNTIALVFDGVDDADTVIAAWNLANPSNTVSLASGNGTDVPDAQTITLQGGGTSGYSSGSVDLGVGITQGSGFISDDVTNNVKSFNIAGNLVGITGNNSMGNLFGTVDTDTFELSVGIMSTEFVIIQKTDQSTYNAALQLDSNKSILKFDGVSLNLANNELRWQDNNDSRFLLPLGDTPTVGQALLIDNIVGDDYQLRFGDVLPVIGANEVAFGDGTTGEVTSDPNFRWTQSTQDLAVGDLFNVGNRAKLELSNSTNEFNIDGAKDITNTGLVFTGSGLDDMSVEIPGFSGIVNETFTLAVDSTGTYKYMVIDGITGTFLVGDVIQQTVSASTATIVAIYDDPMFAPKKRLVLSMVAGPWTTGSGGIHVVTAPFGSGAVAQTVQNSPVTVDTVDFVSSVTGSNPLYPVLNTAYGLMNIGSDFNVAANSLTGHTMGDEWEISYTIARGRMLASNGLIGAYEFGDIDKITAHGMVLQISNLGGTAFLGANASGSNEMGLLINDDTEVITIGKIDEPTPSGTRIEVDNNDGTVEIFGQLKNALAAYDDDADAGAGGLTAGEFYQTTGIGSAPLNVAGIVMCKQ